MSDHRPVIMRRSYIECSCGEWSLKLDGSVKLHSGERANHLLDAFLRHKKEEAAKANHN